MLWLSWIDDNLLLQNKNGVGVQHKKMLNTFDCKEQGEMKEYVGYRSVIEERGHWR